MLQSQRLTKHILHVFFSSFLWKVRPLSSLRSSQGSVTQGQSPRGQSRSRIHPTVNRTEADSMTSVRQDVNTSWKIRGFSSVDMTSQTQIFFFFFFKEGSQAWWSRLVIPAVQRWKEKESKAILGYTVVSRPLWDVWDSITNKKKREHTNLGILQKYISK